MALNFFVVPEFPGGGVFIRWFKSDKPPEFWVSVLAQRSAGANREGSLSAVPEEDSSGNASGVSSYVEVWRSPRQIARPTGGSSSSSGGGSGARFTLWAAPCFLPELGRGSSADTAYYIAVCSGAPPKDKDGQGGSSSLKPAPSSGGAAPGSNNGGGGDCSGPVPSGLPAGCVGWCRVAHWALVAGEGSPSVLVRGRRSQLECTHNSPVISSAMKRLMTSIVHYHA